MRDKRVKLFVIIFSLYVLYLSISVVLNEEVSLKYNAISTEDINHIIHYALLVIVYEIIVLLLPFSHKRKWVKNNLSLTQMEHAPD